MPAFWEATQTSLPPPWKGEAGRPRNLSFSNGTKGWCGHRAPGTGGRSWWGTGIGPCLSASFLCGEGMSDMSKTLSRMSSCFVYTIEIIRWSLFFRIINEIQPLPMTSAFNEAWFNSEEETHQSPQSVDSCLYDAI